MVVNRNIYQLAKIFMSSLNFSFLKTIFELGATRIKSEYFGEFEKIGYFDM
jgi:hypothetical protein